MAGLFKRLKVQLELVDIVLIFNNLSQLKKLFLFL